MKLTWFLIFMVSCGLGYAKEEGKKVAFRDDFNALDRTTWQIGGWPDGVSCADGMLKLKTSGGPAKNISISSATLYSGGSCEARVRFSKLGKGCFYYFGFFNRNPWGNDCAG